jgi:hypothetical protein
MYFKTANVIEAIRLVIKPPTAEVEGEEGPTKPEWQHFYDDSNNHVLPQILQLVQNWINDGGEVKVDYVGPASVNKYHPRADALGFSRPRPLVDQWPISIEIADTEIMEKVRDLQDLREVLTEIGTALQKEGARTAKLHRSRADFSDPYYAEALAELKGFLLKAEEVFEANNHGAINTPKSVAKWLDSDILAKD